MEKQITVEGTIWKVGDKYFFVQDRNWQMVSDPHDKSFIQNLLVDEPSIKVVQSALSKHPNSSHFRFSKETMGFEPDEVHEWSAPELLED